MCKMCTEHYFQRMSIIYLGENQALITSGGGRSQRLTEVSALKGTDEGHVYPSVRLSGWKSCMCFQENMSSPFKLRQEVGC